ncbi:MAG: helix-turn-helix domain-containing protein [Bacilli bacterium]|nr:helix-turn-helix domain-containing protein [Bacilli bacterium]
MVKSSTKVNFELQRLRKEKDLSYDYMAREVGICKAYYWQIEHGNRRLYYDLALKIAKVFDKKPDDIFFEYYK